MNFFSNKILTIRDKIIQNHFAYVSLGTATFNTTAIYFDSFSVIDLIFSIFSSHSLQTIMVTIWPHSFKTAQRSLIES